MKKLTIYAALLLSAAVLAPAQAGTEAAPKPARVPAFPMHLVASSADQGSVTVRYYSLKPWQPFCLVYAGLHMKFGPRYVNPQQCTSADSYGNATLTFMAQGPGPLIVSVILPTGEASSNVLDLEKLRAK